MLKMVEVDEQGVIHLPPELIGVVRPHTNYVVDIQDGRLVLTPVPAALPFWTTMTPEERAREFLAWAASHPPGPNLPDEAFKRENMYD